MSASKTRTKVGVVGFGKLGKYLVDCILSCPSEFELVFVWNRSPSAVESDSRNLPLLTDLSSFAERGAGLIVEVAHP